MPEISEESVTSALESAFDNPAPAPKAVREASPPEDDDPPEAAEADAESDEPVEAAEGDEAPAKTDPEPEKEPEFEIEVNGKAEFVRGKDAIKELLQKGRDYSQKSEVVARARDALAAQFEQQRLNAAFQQAAFEDVTQLRAIDGQLDQYNKIDWASAFDTDPFNALKLKEQRDQLREVRSAKLQELQAKQQQFQQGQAQAAQQMVAAELAALSAKLPEWRNSETRAKEQQEIRTNLSAYGFNETEIDGVRDHRMLLVARDAAKWRALQAEKAAKVQQVRTAPAAVKPGAAQPQTKGQAAFKTTLTEIRKAGRQGNHRAQEQLAQKLFERAFK